MLAEPPKAALLSESFRQYRYLYHLPRLLPAGATVAGRGSHPLGIGAFPRRTEIYGLASWKWIVGLRSGVTTDQAGRMKELEREVRELKRANEILRKAAAFFLTHGSITLAKKSCSIP